MRYFLKKTGFILLAFLLIASIISALSLRILRQSSFYKPSFLANSVSEEKFDYVIIGASNGLTTLNTKVIDSTLNTNGINLSIDDTALSTQYLMLQHFLAEGKQTKFCVLSPNALEFDITENYLSGNDYRFLMYINKPYVYEYYSDFNSTNAKILKWSKWFPMLGVSYYNAELFYPSLQSLLLPDKRNRFDNKGNYVYPLSKKKSSLITEFKTIPITFQNAYLMKIKELCEQHDIQLICYLSPIEAKKVKHSSKEFQVIDHSDLLKDSMYFFDGLHVDPIGRQISSEQFAIMFKEFL